MTLGIALVFTILSVASAIVAGVIKMAERESQLGIAVFMLAVFLVLTIATAVQLDIVLPGSGIVFFCTWVYFEAIGQLAGSVVPKK